MQLQTLSTLTGIINNKYKIYKQILPGGKPTHNHLYLISPINQPNQLLVLKNYVHIDGFRTQTKILKEAHLYGNYVIDAQQNHQYSEGYAINYVILQNAQAQSLLDYTTSINKIPSLIARQFFKKILQSLIYVKNKFNIEHPHISKEDVIMLNNKSIVVSGWTKQNKSTEREIIFDIGELLFSMIFGVGIPGSVFTEKKKRCSLKEWEAIKKNMSKKKIQPPVEGEKQKLIEIPNCLWKFFQICIVIEKYQNITFADLANHQYLSNEFCQTLSQQFIKLQLEKIEKFYKDLKEKEMMKKFAQKKNRQLLLVNHLEDDEPNRDFELGGYIRDYYDFQQEIQTLYSESSVGEWQQYPESPPRVKYSLQVSNIPTQFKKSISNQPEQKIIHLKSAKISRSSDKEEQMKLSKKVSNDSLYEPKNIKKESRKSKLSVTLSKRKKSKLIDKLSFMLMWVQSFLTQNKGQSLVFPQNYVRLCGLGLMDDKFINVSKKTEKEIEFEIKLQFDDYTSCNVDFSELQQNWPDPLRQAIVLKATINLPFHNQYDIRVQTLESRCQDTYNNKLESLIFNQICVAMSK